MNFSLVKGDLLRNFKTGEFFEVVRETYTKRFLDSEDHKMISHGMGDYAGSYSSAIDVLNTHTGLITRGVELSEVRRKMENITANVE